MKKIVLAIGSLLTLVPSLLALADEKVCDPGHQGLVHCTYFTGMPKHFEEGRWIKMYLSNRKSL